MLPKNHLWCHNDYLMLISITGHFSKVASFADKSLCFVRINHLIRSNGALISSGITNRFSLSIVAETDVKNII